MEKMKVYITKEVEIGNKQLSSLMIHQPGWWTSEQQQQTQRGSCELMMQVQLPPPTS